MQVITSLRDIVEVERGTAIALGNFDGVHLGHRDIFRTLVRRARDLRIRSLVFTFEPHPLKVLAPERAPLLLNTAEEKVRLIEASNIDILACIPFSVELASCDAEVFVRDILIRQLHMRAVVVGYDFAFGKGRRGTGDFLREQGQIYGFSVDVLQPVGDDGKPYSSSRVRELLVTGAVQEIPALLGRHYTLAGKVVGGEKRGRTLGFPTANILTDKEQLPAAGVYAVIVRHGDEEYQGLVNIGCRPTYGPGETTIEVYLLDFNGDIYDEELRLYFVARLREERTFADSGSLMAAIHQDVSLGRKILKDAKIIQYKEYLAEDDRCLK
jgi:riboflavin kinase/FMN adenylyltransferase